MPLWREFSTLDEGKYLEVEYATGHVHSTCTYGSHRMLAQNEVHDPEISVQRGGYVAFKQRFRRTMHVGCRGDGAAKLG